MGPQPRHPVTKPTTVWIRALSPSNIQILARYSDSQSGINECALLLTSFPPLYLTANSQWRRGCGAELRVYISVWSHRSRRMGTLIGSQQCLVSFEGSLLVFLWLQNPSVLLLLWSFVNIWNEQRYFWKCINLQITTNSLKVHGMFTPVTLPQIASWTMNCVKFMTNFSSLAGSYPSLLSIRCCSIRKRSLVHLANTKLVFQSKDSSKQLSFMSIYSSCTVYDSN